jgi:hypothetical protein
MSFVDWRARCADHDQLTAMGYSYRAVVDALDRFPVAYNRVTRCVELLTAAAEAEAEAEAADADE